MGLVENRRPLCCVTCNMELLDVDTLIAHYLSHGSSTFICQFCLRRYSRSHWFKFHMKNHADELPIVCPLCDDSFLFTKLHEDHLETVHNLSVSNIGRTLLDNQKNSFMCMECGRWLKSEKHLESHRAMHDMVKGRTVQLKNQVTTIDQPVLFVNWLYKIIIIVLWNSVFIDPWRRDKQASIIERGVN